MNVGIAGSREFPELGLVREYVSDLPIDTVVVSGGARGVDRTAENAAQEFHLPVISFRPTNLVVPNPPWCIERWMFDGTGAFDITKLPERYRGFAPAAFVRNGYIVEVSDRLVVFWDGHSRGTQDTMKRAHQLSLPIEVIRAERRVHL